MIRSHEHLRYYINRHRNIYAPILQQAFITFPLKPAFYLLSNKDIYERRSPWQYHMRRLYHNWNLKCRITLSDIMHCFVYGDYTIACWEIEAFSISIFNTESSYFNHGICTRSAVVHAQLPHFAFVRKIRSPTAEGKGMHFGMQAWLYEMWQNLYRRTLL